MRSRDKEKLKLWLEGQPDYCSYSRVRNFLSDLLSCSKADAEVEMMKLQNDDEIKIISKHTGSGRRVFTKPLVPLSEDIIRTVWDGSPHVTKDASQIADSVHDMTGHSTTKIKSFMESLDNATIQDDAFSWSEDPHDDSSEYIR